MSRVDEALELGADLLTLCRQLERDLDLCRAVTTACCNNQAPRAEEKTTRADLLPGLRAALDAMNESYGGTENSSTRSPHAAPIRRRIKEITTPSAGRDEPFDIYVNGSVHQVAVSDATYESVVKLAGYDPQRILSVMYQTKRNGDVHREGIMHPGCAPVLLEDGMRFDVGDTSNA